MAEVDQSRVYDAGVGKQDQHLQDSTADSNYKVDYVVDAPPRFGGEDTSGDNFGYSDYYEVGQQAYSSGHQRMQGGPGARQGGPGAAAVAGELPPGRLTGRCKWFNGPKGFGFILPDNGSGEVLLLRQLTPIGGGGGFRLCCFFFFFSSPATACASGCRFSTCLWAVACLPACIWTEHMYWIACFCVHM